MMDQFQDNSLFADGIQLIKKQDLPGWNDAARRADELDGMIDDMRGQVEEAKASGFEVGYQNGVTEGRETALKELLVLKQKTARELVITEAALVGLVNTVVRKMLGDLTNDEKVTAAVASYFEHSWSSVQSTIHAHPARVKTLEEYLYNVKPELARIVSVQADNDLQPDQIEFEEGDTRFDVTLASQFEPMMLDLASALNSQGE